MKPKVFVEKKEQVAEENENKLDHLSAELDDKDEIMTVEDMCKIGRSDIKNQRRKDMLYYSVCKCIGIVLNAEEFREKLTNNKTKKLS